MLCVFVVIIFVEVFVDESMFECVFILGDFNVYSVEDLVVLLIDYIFEDCGYIIKIVINMDMDEGEFVEVEISYGYYNFVEEFDVDGYLYWYYGIE